MKHLLYVLILLFSSCSIPRALYIHTPDKTNVPCLTQRGDLRFDVSAKFQSTDSANGSPASFSADAAYAVTENVGIIASYRGIDSRGAKHTAVSSFLWGYSEEQHFLLNGYRVDAGAGVYHMLGRHTLIEAFGCLGAGTIRNSSSYVDPGYYKARFVNGSGQFDFSLHYDNASFSAGSKLSAFKYYELDHAGNTLLNNLEYLVTDRTFVYFTPFIQFSAGYKYLQVNMQTGMEIGMSGFKGTYYRPSPAYLTLGLTFQMATLYKKRSTPAVQAN